MNLESALFVMLLPIISFLGLTYIYGIGRPSADKILAKAEVNPDTRVRDLTDDEVISTPSLA